MTHLGRYVAFLRRQKNLSARQLAQQVGCSNTFIGQIEKGRQSPSLKLAWDIVAALGGDGRYALVALAVDQGIPAAEVISLCAAWDEIEAIVTKSA